MCSKCAAAAAKKRRSANGSFLRRRKIQRRSRLTVTETRALLRETRAMIIFSDTDLSHCYGGVRHCLRCAECHWPHAWRVVRAAIRKQDCLEVATSPDHCCCLTRLFV